MSATGRADGVAAPGGPSTALPAVDVVVATHQRPELLRLAVAAAVGQDYAGEVRVHVVFDRSEPDEAVTALGGPRRPVAVLRNTRTGGLAGARNSGVLHGSAPLVAFCDDDDRWEPGKLTAQVAAMAAQPEALTCVTGIVVEYADRAVVRVPTPDELRLDHLVRHRVMAAHPSSVLTTREALLGPVGLVDEAIPGSYGEDFDWLLRAAAVAPVAVVGEPLVRVRWGGSQFSRQWQTIIDAVDYGLAKHPAFRADRRAHGRLLGRRAFAQAAAGQRGALAGAVRALRVSPGELRAWLGAAVALRLVSAETLLDAAHRRGRGI